MNPAPRPATESAASLSNLVRAIVWGGLICGLLDGTAAAVHAWWAGGTPPDRLFQGVASALLGRAAFNGGALIASLGVLMHFGVAFAGTAICCVLYRRVASLRGLPQWALGAVFGLGIFCAMNFAILPLLSVVRSLYLDTPVRWPGSMGWAQAAIHLVFVGQPIAAAARRFLR